MAVASLVLGIIGLILGFIPFADIVGIILAIVGVVLGALAMKKGKGGIATAGLVISIIALVLALILGAACNFTAMSLSCAAAEAINAFM